MTVDARVVVPHAPNKLYPETVEALALAGVQAEFVPLPEDTSYGQLLRKLWNRQETFIVVEQDIAPRPGDLEKLVACEHGWCGFVHAIGTIYTACLGCTKFSTEFIQEHPDLLERVWRIDYDGMRPGVWQRLDVRMDSLLNPEGVYIHEHWPPVAHYNPSQQILVENVRGWCLWPSQRTPV